MSKFIKVTDVSTGVAVLILAHRVGGVVPHHESGAMIEGVDGANWHVKESLEQIEAQLLRDEFAMRALNGLLSNSGGVVQANPMSGTGYVNTDSAKVAEWSYRIADAMLKERSK